MRSVVASSLELPVIGLGTWELTGDRCRAAVEKALELGYRHIDTAQGYGNEAEVGAAVNASGVARDDLRVVTKAWPDHLVDDPHCAERSLVRLGLSYVDLLLVHWPSPTLPLEPVLAALDRARERGWARAIGVSNFPAGMLQRSLQLAPVSCIQVEYHPYLAQDRLLELARQRGLVLGAYSPLARGDIARDPVIGDIARRLGRTPAQIVLRWLVDQPNVVALPKASSERHLAENLDVVGFALEEDDRARIAALARGRRYVAPDFAPDWAA